uniref:C-X-C motif chemokine n=1 Tax=Ornithorhynchus anatinus TaxID=9258 RepID=F7EHS9_ORNAN
SGMSRAGVAPVLLAVPLLMLALAPVRGQGSGSPLHGPGRCRCLENSSKFIHPNALAKLEFLPKSSSCSNNEVIATLKKSKEEICLNPDSRNVKKLLDTILKKNQVRGREIRPRMIILLPVIQSAVFIEGLLGAEHCT